MLPSAWVNELFSRFTARYGAAWIRQWDGVDMDAVKADWQEELAPFADKSGAIKHALEHLPADRPPNVAQFRALCVGRSEEHISIPWPKADPAVVAAVQQGMKKARATLELSPAAQCIANIDAAAHRAPLSLAQREMRASCVRKVANEGRSA